MSVIGGHLSKISFSAMARVAAWDALQIDHEDKRISKFQKCSTECGVDPILAFVKRPQMIYRVIQSNCHE